jgi:hypothetical protein
MTNGTMRPMSRAQMVCVEGGGFWDGFLCGAGIAVTVSAFLSPDPLSKLTLSTLFTGTVGACGNAFG